LVWKLGNEKLNFKELQIELNKSPKSLPFIKKAKTQRTISIISGVGSIGLFLLANQANRNYSSSSKFLKIGSAVAISTSIIFIIKSSSNTKKAIQQYNSQ
jgi:hypothetical protein